MLLMVSSNASVFQGGLRMFGNPPDLLSVFLMPMTGGVVCWIFFGVGRLVADSCGVGSITPRTDPDNFSIPDPALPVTLLG